MHSRKKWPTLIAVILVLAIAGGLVYRFAFYKPAATTTTTTQKYQSYTVSASDISLSVQGSGAVEAGQTERVTAGFDGTVLTVKAADGDRVKAGDILAVYELPDLEDEIAQLRTDLVAADDSLKRLSATTGTTAIASPVAGLVKSIHVAAGDLIDVAMAKSGALMVISVDKKMTVMVKPLSSAKVEAGQRVNVIVGTKTISGRIRELLTDGSIVVIFDDGGTAVNADATVKASDSTVLGTGKTVINQSFLVTASGGVVNTLSTKVGRTVSVGTTLLRLKEKVLTPAYLQALEKRDAILTDLKEKLAMQKSQTIVAPTAGIVSGLTLSVDDSVKEDQVVCSIIDDSVIELTLSVDELDIPAIKLGQTAKITLDALTDQTYSAKVTGISAIGTYSGGVATYPVTLTIEKPEGILAGMSANAVITVSSSNNVPVIPLAALQTIGNRRFILKADALNADGTLMTTAVSTSPAAATTAAGSTAAASTAGGQMGSPLQKYLVEVTIGLSTDNGVEITSGVTVGDKIAVAVSSGTGTPTGLNLGGMGAIGGGQFGDSRPGQSTVNQGTRSSSR